MFRWYRTREEWEAKGFKVATGCKSTVKRNGEEVFSWGQVIPVEFHEHTALDPHDPDDESDGCIF